jgi:glycosyltransferase involved in cell wall biosynthesis
MNPDVSVIVPTYNRNEKIRPCLEALLEQTTRRAYEIIVVDDGSSDATAKIAREYARIRVVEQEHAGPAAARNRGAQEAAGDIVLFTDDDCRPERDWIDTMASPFDDPEIAGVKGTYLTQQRELTARFVQIEYEEKYDCLRKHRFIDFVDTYSAGFRRRVFLEAGGYDTRFPTASVEDQEFSFRLANAGRKMIFLPEARVWHEHVGSPLAYLRKKFKIGYWKALALRKNPNKITGDTHTPLTLKAQVLLAILFLPSLAAFVLGPWGLLAPAVVAAIFVVTAIPLTLRCFRHNPAVGLVAPFFVFLRAAGLSCGLMKALLDGCPTGKARGISTTENARHFPPTCQRQVDAKSATPISLSKRCASATPKGRGPRRRLFMDNKMRIPSFFIAGAQKSGTTALSEYLRDHPNIFMTIPKEPYFFSDDFPAHREGRTIEEYLALYKGISRRQRAAGEATAGYLYSTTAIPNIYRFNEAAKIIVMLRNPVDLVQALHSTLVFELDEDEPDFEKAWTIHESRRRGLTIPRLCRDPVFLQYARVGRLGEQVSRLMNTFPHKQIKTILFDDFVQDTRKVYEDALSFLEVPSDGRTHFPVFNDNRQYRSRLVRYLFTRSPRSFREIVMRAKKRLRIEGINSKPVRRKPVSTELRQTLAAEFSEDIARLASLIGRDLSHWCNP